MNSLHYGLAPKMKPVSPKRRALVAAFALRQIRPHPEERSVAARLEGWGGPWFETRRIAALLTMRPNRGGYPRATPVAGGAPA